MGSHFIYQRSSAVPLRFLQWRHEEGSIESTRRCTLCLTAELEQHKNESIKRAKAMSTCSKLFPTMTILLSRVRSYPIPPSFHLKHPRALKALRSVPKSKGKPRRRLKSDLLREQQRRHQPQRRQQRRAWASVQHWRRWHWTN